MSDKILVAFATAAGSTGEIAEAIGETLREENAAVDIRPAKEVTDLSDYSAVIMGTGVRAGRVYRDAVKFVKRHQEALSKKRLAYFVVCMTMQEDTPENRAEVSTYLNMVREAAPQLQPVDEGLFGGVLDYSKIPWLLRLILKPMKVQEGDFRDWDAVHDWAVGLHPKLMG